MYMAYTVFVSDSVYVTGPGALASVRWQSVPLLGFVATKQSTLFLK